jgi:hypothetical protein
LINRMIKISGRTDTTGVQQEHEENLVPDPIPIPIGESKARDDSDRS